MELTGSAAALATALALLLGLCCGSFLNVLIYRLPREGLTPSSPGRSFCPSCGAPVAWRDNVPVLSWLLLRGRCRSCRSPISVRYPLVELLIGCLSVVLFLAEGPSPRYLVGLCLAMSLTAVAFIDLEFMVIPNILVWPLQALGLAAAAVQPWPPLAGRLLWTALAKAGWPDPLISLAGSAAGLAAGFLSLYLVGAAYKAARGVKGLGAGDPPLLAMIGACLGLPSILPVLLFSCLIGLLSVIVMAGSGRVDKRGLGKRPIPFGPFLSLGALIYLFAGQGIVAWYLSLMYPA